MWFSSGIGYFTRHYCQCWHFKVLTSTPDPRMPPKYQTSSVICSLSTEVPPGKKSRMLHSTHTINRGIKLIPRHLAKLPEHILTLMFQPPLLVQLLGLYKYLVGFKTPLNLIFQLNYIKPTTQGCLVLRFRLKSGPVFVRSTAVRCLEFEMLKNSKTPPAASQHSFSFHLLILVVPSKSSVSWVTLSASPVLFLRMVGATVEPLYPLPHPACL